MTGRWGEIPFVALTAALTSGICLSNFLHQYLFGLAALGAAALMAAAGIAHLRHRQGTALSLALACMLMNGILLGVAQRDAYPTTDLRHWLATSHLNAGEILQFDGCVSGETDRGDGELVNIVDLHAIQRNGKWHPSTGRAILRMAIPGEAQGDETLGPLRGDRIRGWAAWSAPRNFQNPGSSDYAGFLSRRGIYLLGKAKSARLVETIPGDCLGPWESLVALASRRIKRVFASMEGETREIRAAILTALVAGDGSGLGTQVREAFQNSGTYHVLVVSGLHVAWIAWALAGSLKLMRVPSAAAHMAAAAGIFFYTEIVGFQASVSRSLWMFLLYLGGRALYRQAAPANIALASAFLLLSMRPDWIFDAGFQLSFISVLAICMTGAPAVELWLKPLLIPPQFMGDEQRWFFATGSFHRLGRRLRILGELLAESAADRWHPWCGKALLVAGRMLAGAALAGAGMMVLSLSVQLWLEPLLAFHFNRLSWVAPIANLAVVPLSSLTLATGLGASLLGTTNWMGAGWLDVAGWLASLLLKTAQFISNLPGAWQRCPTPSAEWIIAGLLLAFAWSFGAWRRPYIPMLYTGSLLTILAFGYSSREMAERTCEYLNAGRPTGMPKRPGLLSITILDVGEGDSLVMRFPDSSAWLIDAGGLRQRPSRMDSDQAFDIGEAVVSRFLWNQWIHGLDCVVVTHADIDHAGGVPAILRNFPVRALWTGDSPGDSLMARICTAADTRGAERIIAASGRSFTIMGAKVKVLSPPAGIQGATTNEGSIVLRIEYGRFSALLTGDLEKSAERQLASSPIPLPSRLLKVAHHGSRWATSDLLLDSVKPHWAVISVGRNNSFGHPAPEVVDRILRHGAVPVLTQDQGAITLTTDGRGYSLESYRCGLIETGEFQ